jgi:hypothetical protein
VNTTVYPGPVPPVQVQSRGQESSRRDQSVVLALQCPKDLPHPAVCPTFSRVVIDAVGNRDSVVGRVAWLVATDLCGQGIALDFLLAFC